MSVSRSKYVVCSPWDAKPFDLDIFTWQDKPDGYFFNYWVRIFKEFEKYSSLSGLTFYLVSNHILVNELPSYGNTVVAIIRSDEECWIPPYLGKVRYVFKTYGFQPWCGASLRLQSPASVLKCIRDWELRSWHYLSYLRQNGFSPALGVRKMVVPLGYARQTDLPGKPFELRRYLVGFLGSIENRGYSRFSPKRLLTTPKYVARSRLAEFLQKLAASAPDSVFYGTTASFTESTMTGAGDRYTEIMADTKIALTPRGSSVETYRFFEAMRQGCVVICDRLPRHDFSRLPRHTNRRLGQPGGRGERAVCRRGASGRGDRKSLAWWTKLSERAVARLIAKRREPRHGLEEPAP